MAQLATEWGYSLIVWSPRLHFLVERGLLSPKFEPQQQLIKQNAKDKYSTEEVALSYVEVVQRAKEAMAKYFQEYFRKQRASLGLEAYR